MHKALIERQHSDSDHQVVYVRITNKGLELVEKIDALNESYKLSFIDRVSKEEATLVSKISDKMRG